MASQEIFTTSLLTDANLQGYWRLESNVNDSSPNGYNLTTSGSPAYAAGQFGNGIDLERDSSQYANITEASAPNLDITGSLTLYAWVKPESQPGVNSILAKFSNANTGYILYTDSSGKLNFTCSGLTTNQTVQSSAALSNGTWYQVAGVYNSSAQTLNAYVNGVATTVTASGSIDNNNVFIGLGVNAQGAGDTAANYWDGVIDDAAIFNRALSGADILALYNGTYGTGITVHSFFM